MTTPNIPPQEVGKEYKRVSEASELFKKQYDGVPLEPELLDLFAKMLKAVPREFIRMGNGCRCGNDWCPLNLSALIADKFLPPLEEEPDNDQKG